MRTILILTLVPFVLVIVLMGLLITNPEIEYQIGQVFMRGDGVPKNTDWAFYWLRQAADHGQADAQWLLGRSYLIGVPDQNLPEAVKYLTMGEKQNHNECLKLLSYAYSYGQGVPQDYSKAMELSRRSLKIETDGRELMNMSFLSLILPAPLRNYAKSREYSEKLSKVGFSSAWAYWNLGLVYEYGLDAEKDLAKASQYYEHGARLGDNDCEYALVRMSMEGKVPSQKASAESSSVHKSIADANKQTVSASKIRSYLENAAKTQVLDAQLLLALLLSSESRDHKNDDSYRTLLEQVTRRGFVEYANRLKTVSSPGKSNDPKLAIKQLRDESNDTNGSKHLVAALCKRFGIGGQADFKGFLASLNFGCAQNLADAITLKANILSGMDIDSPNYVEAGKLYLIAAERGQTYAQGQLGMLYALGFGVKHDWPSAISWLEKSASAGDPESQFMLAGFYCDGRGVPPSRKKAIELFESSAKQGHEDAALELGIISGSGEFPDLDQNTGESTRWLKYAASFGFQEANYYMGTTLTNQHKSTEALSYFKAAADNGHLLSQIQLGKLYVGQDNLIDARKCFEAAAQQGNEAASRELKLLAIRSAILGNNREATSLVVAKTKIAKGTTITGDMIESRKSNRGEDDADWRNDILTQSAPVVGTVAAEDIEEGSYISATEIDVPENTSTED